MVTKVKTQKKVLPPIEPELERLNILNDVLVTMTADGKAKIMGRCNVISGSPPVIRPTTIVFFFDAVPVKGFLIGV